MQRNKRPHLTSASRHHDHDSDKDKQNMGKNTSTVSLERRLPLLKKTIYVDVTDKKRAQEINLKLKKLGATIETFLSKDVHYVISSSAPSWSAAQKKCHAALDTQSPESPLFVSTPSPHTPEAGGEKLVVQTRGQALAQLARGHRRSPSPNSVLSAAQKLGIQIISVEAAERWLNKECALHQVFRRDTANPHPQESDRKRKQKQEKCKLLKEPFVKVESTTQHYRPQYALLNMWPLINVDTASGTCPFDGKGLSIPHHAIRGDRDGEASFGTYPNHGNPGSCSAAPRRSMEGDGSSRLLGLPVLTAGDIRRHQEKKRKEARRRGWCECCLVKYEDIDKHIKESCHKEFARGKQNYEKLDAVIASCSSTGDFLRNVFLQHCTRQAAIMATPVISPGSGCYSAPSDQVLVLDFDTPKKFLYHSDTIDLNSDSRPQPRFSTPMHTPVKLAASLSDYTQDGLSIMPLAVSGDRGDGPAKGAGFAETSSADLTAVVIRRSSARGVYASPRRRLAHHSPVKASFQNLVDYKSVLEKPKVMERSMIFRDSPIASLLCVSEKVSRLQKNFVGDGFSTLRRCLSLPIVNHSGSVVVEKDLGAGETASQRLNATNEFMFSDFRPNMHTVPLLLLDPKRKTKLSAVSGLSLARRCLKKDFLSRLKNEANELVHNNLSASTVDTIEDAVLGEKLSSTDGTELPSALNTYRENYLSKKEELFSVSCTGSNEAVKASLTGIKAKEFSQTGEKVVTVDLRLLNEIQFTEDYKLSCENENKCISTVSTCAKLGKMLTIDLDQCHNKQKFSCSANLIDAVNCKKPLSETNVHSLIKSAYQKNSEDQSVEKETKLSLKKLGVQTKVTSLITEAKSLTSKTKIPEPREEKGTVSASNIVGPKSPVRNRSSSTNQLLHTLSKKGQSEAVKPTSIVSELERAELKSPLRNVSLGNDQPLEKEKYYSPWRKTRSMTAGSVSTKRPSNLILDKEEYQTPSPKIKFPTFYENNLKNTDIYKTPEKEQFSTVLSQHTPEKSGLMTVECIAIEKQNENFYSPWRKTRSQTAQMSRSQESKDQFTRDNIPANSESLSDADNSSTTARGRSSSTPGEVLGTCKDACFPRHCESDMHGCYSTEDGCQVDEAKKPADLYSVLAEKEHLSCLSSGPLRLIKTVKQLQLEEDKKDASSLPGDIYCSTSEIASVCALHSTAVNGSENSLPAVQRFVGDTDKDSCRQTASGQTATGSSCTFNSSAPSTPPILMCQTRLNTESSVGTIVSNVELESSKRSRKSRKPNQTDVKSRNVETTILDDHCSSTSASIQPMLNSTPINHFNCTKEVMSAGADPNTLQDESGLSSSKIYLKLVRCSLASSDKRPTKRVKLNNSWKLLSDQSMSRLLHSEPDEVTFKGFKGDEMFPSDLTFESVSEVEVTDDEEREWVIDQKVLVERSPFNKISEKGEDLGLATSLHESFVRDHLNSELLKTEYAENIFEEINSGVLGEIECKSSLNLPECLQIAGNYSGGKSKQQKKNIPFKSPGKLRKRDKEHLDKTPYPNCKNRKIKDACMLSPMKYDNSDGALQELIPTFSSPGKGSDSSWGDACDIYLSQSFQQQLQQTAQRLRRSPRKHSLTLSGSGTKKRCRSRSRSRSRDRAGIDKPTTKRCLKKSLRKPSVSFEGDAISGQPTHQLQGPAEVPVVDGKLFNKTSSRKLPHLVSPLHTISANVFSTSSPGSSLTSPHRKCTTNTFMLVSQPVPFN